jgi:hypothetical protein
VSRSLPEDGYSTFDLKGGDLDGDGDMDVVAASRWNLVLTNVRHQLAWVGTPRIGKPLTLELTGPPTASWVLYASDAGPAALDRLGEHRWPARYIASGYLDAQGHGYHTIHVPADPSLVGDRWLWKAVIDGVPSNPEITTLTDL